MPQSDPEAIELLQDAMRSVETYYRARGIFQEKIGFGARPAVVVVDFALGWTDDAYAGGSQRLDGPVEFLPSGANVERVKHEDRINLSARGG